ncbi:hypothetical protein F4808DRAFT_442430 [Astrocystis sublimbata]|nr:hypothetical protein F4808DRAFT_442430 [Astrocystis sublimbata]
MGSVNAQGLSGTSLSLDDAVEAITKEYREEVHFLDGEHQKQRADCEKTYRGSLRAVVCNNNSVSTHSAMASGLDDAVEAITKDYREEVHYLDGQHQKQRADREKAYRESLRAIVCSSNHASTHAAMVSGDGHGNTSSLSPIPTTHPLTHPPINQKLSSQKSTSTITVSSGRYQPSVPEETSSYTIQVATERPINQTLPAYASNSSTSAAIHTDPASNGQPLTSRTITFDQVYQNGQAKTKHIIAEWPKNSQQWYIFKCWKHKKRFGNNQRSPIRGAARHINSAAHNNEAKSYPNTIRLLGWRVVDCTRELADMNNSADMMDFEQSQKRKRDQISGNESQLGKRPKTDQSPRKIITSPKTFHVYNCLRGESYHPVVVLGWDDQKTGNMQDNLASTGLLDWVPKPPDCYVYKYTGGGKPTAIAGWAPGFGEGGDKVEEREFPVRFFNFGQQFSWVTAKDLEKCPLFEPCDNQNGKGSFEAARQWIAKREGFPTWNQFQKARQGTEENHSPELGGSSTSTVTAAPRSPSPESIPQRQQDVVQASIDESDESDYDYVASDSENSDLGERPENDCPRTTALSYNLRSTTQAESQSPFPLPENELIDIMDVGVAEADMGADHLLSIDACIEVGSRADDPSAAGVPAKSACIGAGGQYDHVHKDNDPLSYNKQAEIAFFDEVVNRTIHSPQAPSSRSASTIGERGHEEAESTAERSESAKKTSSSIQFSNAFFKPRENSGLPEFEVSFYCKRGTYFIRQDEWDSLSLYYGANDRTIGTIPGASIPITIDPTELSGIKREEIPGTRGNILTTLVYKNPDVAPIKIAFERPRGSNISIGKLQSRELIRWIRTFDENIPLEQD